MQQLNYALSVETIAPYCNNDHCENLYISGSYHNREILSYVFQDSLRHDMKHLRQMIASSSQEHTR